MAGSVFLRPESSFSNDFAFCEYFALNLVWAAQSDVVCLHICQFTYVSTLPSFQTSSQRSWTKVFDTLNKIIPLPLGYGKYSPFFLCRCNMNLLPDSRHSSMRIPQDWGPERNSGDSTLTIYERCWDCNGLQKTGNEGGLNKHTLQSSIISRIVTKLSLYIFSREICHNFEFHFWCCSCHGTQFGNLNWWLDKVFQAWPSLWWGVSSHIQSQRLQHSVSLSPGLDLQSSLLWDVRVKLHLENLSTCHNTHLFVLHPTNGIDVPTHGNEQFRILRSRTFQLYPRRCF